MAIVSTRTNVEQKTPMVPDAIDRISSPASGGPSAKRRKVDEEMYEEMNEQIMLQMDERTNEQMDAKRLVTRLPADEFVRSVHCSSQLELEDMAEWRANV